MKLYKVLINALFTLSIILIVWINFFKNFYISAPLWLDVDTINRLIETISIAYLTSYIFYVIIYVFKSNQDKRIILPFVADYIYVAMNNCVYFCFSLRSNAGLEYIPFETSIYDRELKIYPNKDEIKTICSTINPNEEKEIKNELPGFITIPHFFGIMIKYTHQIDYFLKIVLEKSMFLDTELLRLLTDIQTHGFHQDMMSYEKNMLLTAKHRHDNLIVYEQSLLSYFELFVKLEKYSETNLKKYVEREALKIRSRSVIDNEKKKQK